MATAPSSPHPPPQINRLSRRVRLGHAATRRTPSSVRRPLKDSQHSRLRNGEVRIYWTVRSVTRLISTLSTGEAANTVAPCSRNAFADWKVTVVRNPRLNQCSHHLTPGSFGSSFIH